MLSSLYSAISPTAVVITAVSLMLFLGFAMTRVTKRLKLPNVTAYILVGVLVSPYCFDLVPQNIIEGMDFLSDIALAFIAFSTGEFFRMSILRRNGPRVVIVSLVESAVTASLIFCTMFFLLRMNLALSVTLSALAVVISPSSTMMTIRQTGSKGDFVDTLLQVSAVDDVVGLLFFSVAVSIGAASEGTGIDFLDIITPVLVNLAVIAVGCLFGVFMKLLMSHRSQDNRLIVSVALLFAFCGICAACDVSPLLGCMSMGTVYINISNDENLFKQLNYFSPPLLLLFFVRSGAGFNLDALIHSSGSVGAVPLIVISIVYFAVRIAGKYGGAFAGCAAVKKPHNVRNYLGLALIPQAGVAIGLSALGARSLGGATGDALETIILASSILYELVGPGCAKLSLYLSGAYSDKLEDLTTVEEQTEEGEPKSNVEILIERIQKIQQELPAHNTMSEEEAAFLEGAEQHFAAMGARHHSGKLR
ncbi:MAG: cation:proton antiporter [Clostridia bacterium]|nr:cation:proton antiporter [Clostridia bacterium]